MTRIIQLSDCHVSADPAAPYRGENPRANLESLLPRMRAWKPEFVLATGDLSEDGSAASYAYLAEQLDGLGVPVMPIPGNHDHTDRLQAELGDAAVEAPRVVRAGHWELVLLNSAVKNEVPGRCSPGLLDRLDDALAASPTPKLVALHHQPMPVGSPWIDRYPLREPDAFWSVLDRHPGVRLVVWGHIHHAVALERGTVHALGCPSTASNSLAGQERFTPDPQGPACRWIELQPDGRFSTGLLLAQ